MNLKIGEQEFKEDPPKEFSGYQQTYPKANNPTLIQCASQAIIPGSRPDPPATVEAFLQLQGEAIGDNRDENGSNIIENQQDRWRKKCPKSQEVYDFFKHISQQPRIFLYSS